jgi:hypothetical protein
MHVGHGKSAMIGQGGRTSYERGPRNKPRKPLVLGEGA